MSTIRQAELRDLAGVYRVCLETGSSGDDATGDFDDPDLLGHVYAGPYVVGARDYAYVLVDSHGVGGYVLGAPDTARFEAWQEQSWWPPLREQYRTAHQGKTPRRQDSGLIDHINHPPRVAVEISERYPAHLHIDLASRMRSQGYGRRLIEVLVERFREHGASGMHLEVALDNANAIQFYEHLGLHQVTTSNDGMIMGTNF